MNYATASTKATNLACSILMYAAKICWVGLQGTQAMGLFSLKGDKKRRNVDMDRKHSQAKKYFRPPQLSQNELWLEIF